MTIVLDKEQECVPVDIIISEDIVQPKIFRRRTDATSKYNKNNPPYNFLGGGCSLRSLSVSHQAQPVPIRRRGNLRRKSMSIIRKGHTGEHGSDAFNQALERDAEHEIHPGWKSIRKIAGVVG